MGAQVMSGVEKRLSEIEARLDAATPGPWVAESAKESWCGVYSPGGSVLLYGISSYEDDVAGEYAQDLANVTFAANAREDIAWLICNLTRALQEANAYCHAYNELVDMIGLCSCDPIWTNRGLHGPHCMWNNTGVADIDEALANALASISLQRRGNDSTGGGFAGQESNRRGPLVRLLRNGHAADC